MQLCNLGPIFSHPFSALTVVLFLGTSGPPSLLSQPNQQVLDSLIRRADSLLTMTKFKQAEVLYSQALVFDDHSAAAFKGLGKIAYSKDRWRKGHEWFEKALAGNPYDAEAKEYLTTKSKVWQLVILADSLREKGDLKQAEKKYKKALDHHDQYTSAFKGLAKVAYEKQDWKKFNKWIREALEIDPQDTEALELLQNNPELRSLLVEGEKLSNERDYKQAEKVYRKVLKINKKSLAALRWFGVRAFEAEDWGDVKDWFKKVLKVRPPDLESKYSLGIAYRETGKSKGNILKAIQFGTSRKYFDSVIASDSTFRDVLYQRGQLERLKKKWLEAIKWGHRQVALKPNSIEGRVGLLKFYRLFLEHRGDDDIEKWLRSSKSDWGSYVWGEYRRKKKDYTQAESVFKGLLGRDLSFGHAPVYWSLVRLYLQTNDEIQASNYFNNGLASMETDLEARFMFEECKYIFRPKELELFRDLPTLESKKAFFERFWSSRNPTPASSTNARALAHFKRLIFAEQHYRYDGIRSWANNPDKAGNLRFPETYFLNQEFNDKGLIYIRHGEPDDRVSTVGAAQSNESWQYFRRDDREQMTFHFLVDAIAYGNNWRLVSYLTDFTMMEDRVSWDPTMARLLLASTQVEFNSAQNQVADNSRYQVFQAMSTDFHSWDRNVQELALPYFVSYFRGAAGQTRMEIYAGSYIDELLSSGEQTSNEGVFEHGAGVFDKNWNKIEATSETVPLNNLSSARVYKNLFVQRYNFGLQAGTYNLSIHGRLSAPLKIGLSNFESEAPDFESASLMLSDFVLAYEIKASDSEGSLFDKDEVSLVPNPSKLFDLADLVYLYFEIYNLTKNADGETSFEIENEMTQRKKKKGGLKGVLGLGGGSEKSISLKETRTGADEKSVEYTSFDVSKLEAGKYRLTVKVTDLTSRQTVQKSIELDLDQLNPK